MGNESDYSRNEFVRVPVVFFYTVLRREIFAVPFLVLDAQQGVFKLAFVLEPILDLPDHLEIPREVLGRFGSLFGV